MIQAKLVDGRTLEFPDGTEQSIVDRAVRVEMGLQPAEGTDPVSALGKGPEPPTLYIGPEPPPVEPQKPFGERVLEEIPQVGGGIVGGVATAPLAVKAGIAGTAIGGPIVGAGAALGTTALGVAFGAGTGEAYKQIGQQLSGSLDAPKTSIEAAKRVGKAGATEGAWDLVGGLAMKGFGKIIAPLKKKVIEESIDAVDLFKDKLKPIVLLPAEATESRILDLLQNVSEASIIGGASIQKFKTGRIKFFDDFADSLIDEFGKRTDPTDLGNLFVTSISNSRAVHSKAASILYNSVKAGRVKTQISSLKNFAGPLQKRAVKLEGIEAKNAGDDLMDAVMSLPDQLSYKEATELRSRLISRINEFSVINKKAPAIGKAKKMVGLLDKAIGKSLKGIGVPTPKAGKKRTTIQLKSGKKITVGKDWNTAGFAIKTPDGKIHKAMGRGEAVGGDLFHIDIAGRIAYGKAYKKGSAAAPFVEGKEAARKQFITDTKKIKDGSDMGYVDAKGNFISRSEVKGIMKEVGKLKVPTKMDKTLLDPISGKPVMKTGTEGTIKLPKFKAAIKAKGKIYTGKTHLEAFDKVRGDPGKVDAGYMDETGKWLTTTEVENIYGTVESVQINDLIGEFNKTGKIPEFLKDGKPWVPSAFKKSSPVPTGPTPTGPTPLEAWRTANRFYKDGQKKFNSTLLRRLVKLADETGTGAEMIASAIFKPQHVTSVRKVKAALKDDPATWKKMQGFFMQHIMQKSTDSSGDIVGKKLINNISGRPGSFGMPMLKEVFTDPQTKTLKAFGEAVKLTQEKRAEGAGRVLIQLTQAGAIGAVLTGNLALPAATVIIAPAIMSKMMLNPKMAKLLTMGLTLPAKAPEAAGIMTRLAAAAWRIQMEQERGENNETVR